LSKKLKEYLIANPQLYAEIAVKNSPKTTVKGQKSKKSAQKEIICPLKT
jgi:hypothetical protein